ncbi:MAG: glycosyl transferase group 1, partial [uncultured bacterium]
MRFLTPLIWKSFDLSKYDLVISSASWYITKGFGSRGQESNPSTPSVELRTSPLRVNKQLTKKKPIEICYCHTPPRWLYGYSTSINFQKYAIVRAYAVIVGHFMRIYDFKQAQKVNYFIANSKEVAGRIKKFYRRDSKVIYPPVSLPKVPEVKKENFYFIVSRIVGGKGLDLAIEAALRQGFKLKIAGSKAGYYFDYDNLLK